jgi:hypothetical protein
VHRLVVPRPAISKLRYPGLKRVAGKTPRQIRRSRFPRRWAGFHLRWQGARSTTWRPVATLLPTPWAYQWMAWRGLRASSEPRASQAATGRPTRSRRLSTGFCLLAALATDVEAERACAQPVHVMSVSAQRRVLPRYLSFIIEAWPSRHIF